MSKVSIQIMDIYPKMLEDSYDLCEEILKDYGYTEQEFFQYFNQDLDEHDLTDLSNRLVGIMFSITEDLIKKKDPNVDVSYYINGSLDTHFYIDGEEQ